MTWINKSIETHSFFHILSLPFINKTPIPLQYLSSIICDFSNLLLIDTNKYININNVVYPGTYL